MKLLKSTVLLFILITTYSLASDEVKNYEILVDRVVGSHPELLSLEEGLRSEHWDSKTKNIYPDPKIGLAYRSYPVRSSGSISPDFRGKQDTPGMTGRELSISQEIPYPGRLLSEKKLAVEVYKEQESRLRIAKNQFLKDLYTSLIERKILEEEIQEYKQVKNILSSLSRISNAGFITGKDSTFSTLRDRNDMVKIAVTILELETRKEEVGQILEYYISSAEEEQNSVHELEEKVSLYLDKKLEGVINDIRTNLDTYVKANPTNQLYQASNRVAKEKEILDQSKYYPDAEVFLAYMKRNSELYRISENPLNYGTVLPMNEFSGDLISFGVSLKIPIWSWGWKNDIVKRNQSSRKQANYSELANERKVKSTIQRIIETIQGNKKRIQYYETELLPTLNRSSQIKTASSSGAGDASSILRLKLEYNLARAELKNLYREKMLATINLLVITDQIVPNSSLRKPL